MSKYLFDEVFFLGQGGVGWPAAQALCKVTDGDNLKITICDGDNFIGGAGFKRFPPVHIPETPKVEWVRDHIQFVWENSPPDIIPRKFEPVDFTKGVLSEKNWKKVLFVDCTDMAYKDREAVWEAAMKAEVGLMMRVSYEGAFGGIVNVAAGLPLVTKAVEDGPGGYAEVPDWPLSMAAGGIAVKYIIHALVTGDVVEGQYNFPYIKPKEETKDVEDTTSGVLPPSEADAGSDADGEGHDIRVGRGGVGRTRGVRPAAPGRTRRKVVKRVGEQPADPDVPEEERGTRGDTSQLPGEGE